MSSKPWYQEGLKFECTLCGKCCTGTPGFVWVNKQEIENLAAACGETSIGAFERKFIRIIGIRKSLKEHRNGDCVFFDRGSSGCCVYDARPRQCRTWPFWDSNLRTPESWADTCRTCPGSGIGQLCQLEQIEQRRAVIRI